MTKGKTITIDFENELLFTNAVACSKTQKTIPHNIINLIRNVNYV